LDHRGVDRLGGVDVTSTSDLDHKTARNIGAGGGEQRAKSNASIVEVCSLSKIRKFNRAIVNVIK
jgi:hypothetical protein